MSLFVNGRDSPDADLMFDAIGAALTCNTFRQSHFSTEQDPLQSLLAKYQ